jgi:hypothetical protein
LRKLKFPNNSSKKILIFRNNYTSGVFMKKIFALVCLAAISGSPAFSQGKTPLTSGDNLALKLDAALSPIWAGLAGDAALTA